MEFLGTNLPKGKRIRAFSPVMLKFGEKWTAEQIEARRKELEPMRVLDTKYGEGRGRTAVESQVVYDNLNDHFGVSSHAESFKRLVELDSPYIVFTMGTEWAGTVGGAQKVIQSDAERLGLRASFKATPKDRKGKDLIFTIRQGEGLTPATVSLPATIEAEDSSESEVSIDEESE